MQSASRADVLQLNGADPFRLAFRLSPLGMCVSRERRIALCNPAFAEMFGYAELELLNASLAMLYPSEAEFEVQGEVGLPLLKEASIYRDERVMRRQGGDLFWCRVTGSTLDKDAPYACTVWVFENISDRRSVCARLSPREGDVAQQLARGATSKQIAKVLDISHRTVEVHRSRIMRKLGAANHGEVIARLVSIG